MSNKLVNEFAEISKADLGPNYINESGVKLVTIKDVKLSESNTDYKGNPYIEITLEDKDGAINNAKFFRVTENDSDNAKKVKTKMLKEIFINAKADQSKIKSPIDYLNSIKGNKIKVFFRKEEYIGYDKDNFNKPIIKTIVKYAWSAEENGNIFGNQSHLLKPLNEDKKNKFNFELEQWEKNNNTQQGAISIDNEISFKTSESNKEDDNFPF
jgi:hypothetical protein